MAEVQLDTVDALMARYAAGVLPEPARVLVEAHLQMQSVNRPKVAEYEMVVGGILEHMEPVSLKSRDTALRAVFAAAAVAVADTTFEQPETALFPKAIRDFAGLDAAEIPWKRKLPGFKEYSLGKIDGCDVSFFWLKPGRVIPAHTHEGYELSLVLDGAFNDTRGRFAKGDISVADESIDHRPVAEAECPCIGFAVSQAPVKLTGSWRQLLGDMIG
ncbi:cupin domain-containing protein [Pararhizobium sp. DWP1-1-3]|uniref:cupin domain-containing protein n=1 Tax=Pararhizobium sp. DWP1-1-3 TaxID=2804652 RepID=UPI003CE814B1